MNRPEELLRFAQQTIQRCVASRLPWAREQTSLRDHYVELQVATSTGERLPVGQLLGHGTRLIIVGEAGSGKTTALKDFAVKRSEEYIEGTWDALPVYLPLRELEPSKPTSLQSWLSLLPNPGAQPLLLLLDGLDEVHPSARGEVRRAIADASSQLANSQIVVATRPSGLSPPLPDSFRFYHLEALGISQAFDIIAKLAPDKDQVERFRYALTRSSSLLGLLRTPLLLQLLWRAFESEGRVPSVRADIYQTATDLLLYSWDSARMIRRDVTGLSIERVHDVLGAVAAEAFEKSRPQILRKDLLGILKRLLPTQSNASGIVSEQLLSSGLLVESDASHVAFAHLSFLEFYAARYFIRTPLKLPSLIARAGPQTREVALFAAGMMLDVAPLVEAAVERRELILAAGCLREGRTENRSLEAYVLDELRRELGSDLVVRLADGLARGTLDSSESIHSVLLRLLTECRQANHLPHEKGRRFEQFCAKLFEQAFKVIAQNTSTESGEVDLILENTGTDPFWSEWGGDILVECKNWSSSRPLKETAAFAQKVRSSRGRLGFFVSMDGFTEDAVRTLRNQVADRDAPLIVPITGAQISTMLENREKFDLFFRGVIRKMKHLYKW
jgi:hypothetical protein